MLALCLGVLAACAVGPDYVKPDAPVGTQYKEMEGWKVAEPKDHLVRGKWWEIFNDPQLNALAEQVNISNQNIAAAEGQFRQARALVRVARAAYFPTVTIGSSLTRSQSSGTLTSSTAGIPVTVYSLPVNATWEMDLWGRIRRSVESARASAQATAADLENVRLAAQAELTQDYFQLRALDAQRELLTKTVAAFEKSLELTQNRYKAGIVSRADVLQAETQLKTARAQLVDVGVQRSQLEHAIAVLIGKPASVFSIPASPLTAVPPPVPVGLPSELLERRPDIAAAERRMAAANAQIGVAIAAFFPRVTLGGSAGYQSGESAEWLQWPSRFWSIGPSASETVFTGGSRRGQTEQARGAYDTTVASYRQQVLKGFQEVEDNLSTLRILEQESRVQGEAVTAAQQSLAITLNQYKAGIVGYLSVITAQTVALNNEQTALSIRSRRMTAAVLLIKALGGGWDASQLPQDRNLTPDGGK
jgi:NodT family efflux transporter outer membrane factor (OMF) lipoprotein